MQAEAKMIFGLIVIQLSSYPPVYSGGDVKLDAVTFLHSPPRFDE